MKIRTCSDYVKEGKNLQKFMLKESVNAPDFLYHACEEEDLASIKKNGLVGIIYLKETPDEAKEHHPIAFKVDVRNRDIKKDKEGWIVKDVPADLIERIN